MLKKNGNSCKRIPKSMYAFHVNELQNITIQLAQWLYLVKKLL